MASLKKSPFETFIFKTVIWFFSLTMERGGVIFSKDFYIYVPSRKALTIFSKQRQHFPHWVHWVTTNPLESICLQRTSAKSYNNPWVSRQTWGPLINHEACLVVSRLWLFMQQAEDTLLKQERIKWSHELPNFSVMVQHSTCKKYHKCTI